MEQEENRQRAVDYLFGRRMSEEQRERYEELFFADPNVLEELEIVRQDLIDEYIRGELQGEDLRQFKALLLKLPALRSDVELTRNVIKLAAARRLQKPASKAQGGAKYEVHSRPIVEATFLSWLRTNNRRIIVFASALVIVALSFLMWREVLNSNEASLPDKEFASSNAESNANQSVTTDLHQPDGNRSGALQNSNQTGIADSHKPDNNTNKNSTIRPPEPPPQITQPQQNQPALARSFTLTHTVMGTQSGNLLVIEPDDKNVRLVIPQTRGNPAARYRVVIRVVDGAQKSVYESGFLAIQQDVSGGVLVLTVPSALFTAQYYVLSIYVEKARQQELDKFSFRVEKK